jgi:eukaryotic-like serine/threonine-protein kinase
MPAAGDMLFGRYRLDRRLGIGGTAEVWQARDEQLGRDVAIKLLHRHLVPDERSRQRFAGEARAVAALSHPGIVGIHDVVVGDDLAAIVLELVEGEPLCDRIAEDGPLSPIAAAGIAAQIADALQSAHDRGLVHRDVKPANVLLSADGRARLVDFGIARALDEPGRSVTMPGTIMGTLRYMAPEQLAGQSTSAASDVYGLGAILYEMLAGRPPYDASTPAALVADQRIGAPALPTAEPDLSTLARLALDRSLDRRPRSAGSMSVLLRGWLVRQGVSPDDLPAVVVVGLKAPRPLPIAAPSPVTRLRIAPQPVPTGISARLANLFGPAVGHGPDGRLLLIGLILVGILAMAFLGMMVLTRFGGGAALPSSSPVASAAPATAAPTIIVSPAPAKTAAPAASPGPGKSALPVRTAAPSPRPGGGKGGR